MRLKIPGLLIACLVPAACDRGVDARGSSVVRDSADVRIVESAAPAWDSASAWRVADTPSVVIGVEDGPPEYLLDNVKAAVRLSGGRIAVANGGTGEIRIYAAAGEHAATLGRRGSGPGEFEGLDRLWAAGGDTLIAYDAIQRRFTVFAPDGRVAATLPLPVVEGRPGATLLLGRFADGSVLVKAGAELSPDTREGLDRREATYARAALDGSPVRKLGSFFDGEAYYVKDGPGVSAYARPFAPAPQTAVGGDAFYYSAADAFEVRRFRPDGRLEAVFRKRQEPVAVTDEDVREYREQMLEGVSGPDRARLERVLASIPFPDRKPAHGRMLVDAEGSLWVLETKADDDPRFRWSVFDPDGVWLGTVEVPAGFRVLEVGADYVLGVRQAPDTGIEEVRVYPLRKPEAGE
ncbi:MAG TPA: hypothetical protein VF746_23130 [Longimicrobium sp.]